MKNASLVTGCIITALLAGQVAPLQTFATEKNSTEEQKKPSVVTTSSTLQDLGTQTILLKAFALTVLKQPNIVITTMPDLISYQEKTKQHARYWLDTLQPNLINVNQQLIEFQQKFQNYYDKLIELAGKIDTDTSAKQDFVTGITKLQESLANNQNQLQTLSTNLQQFQTKFSTDVQNFIDVANTAQKSLENKEGGIEQLAKQIETLHSDITSQIGSIIGGTISTIFGIGAITLGSIVLFATEGTTLPIIVPILAGITAGTGALIGGSVTVEKKKKKLDDKLKELEGATQKLTAAQADVAALTLLKQQLSAFKENTVKGQDSLEGFEDNWNTLQQSFTQLQNNLNQIKPDSAVLQDQLAKIKTSVDDLATQAKQQEKIITDISYQ